MECHHDNCHGADTRQQENIRSMGAAPLLQSLGVGSRKLDMADAELIAPSPAIVLGLGHHRRDETRRHDGERLGRHLLRRVGHARVQPLLHEAVDTTDMVGGRV